MGLETIQKMCNFTIWPRPKIGLKRAVLLSMPACSLITQATSLFWNSWFFKTDATVLKYTPTVLEQTGFLGLCYESLISLII